MTPWQVEAQFTVCGHALPKVDLTPALGLALLAFVVYLLMLAG